MDVSVSLCPQVAPWGLALLLGALIVPPRPPFLLFCVLGPKNHRGASGRKQCPATQRYFHFSFPHLGGALWV